jgi:hypothetical protein
MPDKKCWFTETTPQELGIKQAFAWLTTEESAKNGVILAAVTNGVLERALSEVLDQRTARKIVAEEIRQIDGFRLTIVTEKKKFWQRGNNRIVLALYPNKSLLDELDGIDEISDLVVVVWTPTDVNDWKLARNPTRIGSAPAPARTQSLIQNRTVRNAMKSLSMAVNESTGLGHPADKSRAVDTFFILLENRERYDPKEIKAFLIAEEGWEPVRASEVEDLAQSILEGKKPRRENSWRSNIIEIWRSEQ